MRLSFIIIFIEDRKHDSFQYGFQQNLPQPELPGQHGVSDIDPCHHSGGLISPRGTSGKFHYEHNYRQSYHNN